MGKIISYIFVCIFLIFLYNQISKKLPYFQVEKLDRVKVFYWFIFYFYFFMVIRKKAVENEAMIQKVSKLLYDLEIDFKNISHYILSFVHRSIVNEKPDYTPEHNERLEFLGDAVLELVVTDNLYHDYPKKSEGLLTDIRSSIVRGRNLALIAKKLNF